MRPAPTQMTSPSPHSCSPSTLMRFSTRSLIACASSDVSVCAVNEAQSGFCPAPSTFRYEIKYFGMATLLFVATALALLEAWMARSRWSFHQRGEAAEKIVGIVRARRGLGMVLHREHGELDVPQSLARVVVEVVM